MKSTKYLGLLLFILLAINCKKDDDNDSNVVLDSEKKITFFLFDASSNNDLSNDIAATINESTKTISATVPYGTNITSLQPTIQASAKAVVNTSGAKDFTNAVVYKVTAEDKSAVNYTATITVEANDEKAISGFQFLADDNGLADDVTSILDEAAKTITVYVPNTADITNLSPTIEVSADAMYAPTGFQNFTDDVPYTVTAEDGFTAVYQATVIPVKIEDFRFVKDLGDFGEFVVGEGTINDTTSEIEVIVSDITDVTDLPIPEIMNADVLTITPSGQQNFMNPVNYSLMAPNGISVTYKVTVRKAFKSITGFRFNRSQNPALSTDVIGTINEQQKTIAVVLPKGTSPNVRNSLTPSISVTVGSNATVSPTAAQNFSNAVEYTVTGLDGSTNTYTVSVIISP